MLSALRLSDRYLFFFFFNDTATTEIYTLSLHDALPISSSRSTSASVSICARRRCSRENRRAFSRATAAWLVSVARNSISDRKSTRLNSSHSQISYAVFCLKKKNKHQRIETFKNCNRHTT